MKLRNKKTGEIAEPFGITCINGRTFVQFDDGKGSFKFEAHSLAELNADWEDYEEPKKCHYYIETTGRVIELVYGDNVDKLKEELCKIGNYFSSREEAEKAVEKLKAWKRLKDKGFVWQDWEEGSLGDGMFVIVCQIPENNWETDVVEDLDLLFGGEE